VTVDAAERQVAGIISAGVLVVTDNHLAADASALLTVISGCAGILVIAITFSRQVLTTRCLGTAIGRAWVAVVTIHVTRCDALSQVTVVACCARVSIIAGCLIEQVEAALPRVAGVVGARILVVAGQQRCELARSPLATVSAGARVAVITRGQVGTMLTPGCRVTGVVGTRIVVAAVNGLSGLAGLLDAGVGQSAGVSIAARGLVGLAEAPGIGQA